MATNTKYRPVVTPEEITLIHELLKAKYLAHLETNYADIDESLLLGAIRKFATLRAKVDNNAIAPAYTTTEKPNLLESLGGTPAASAAPAALTKEQYWEVCYQKYSADSLSCSIGEIEAAQEHRYLNDLMTPDEVARYEAKTLGDL